MARKKCWLSWSSGKDSAWALHVLRQRDDLEVVGLLTTLNGAAERVAMHAVRRQPLRGPDRAFSARAGQDVEFPVLAVPVDYAERFAGVRVVRVAFVPHVRAEEPVLHGQRAHGGDRTPRRGAALERDARQRADAEQVVAAVVERPPGRARGRGALGERELVLVHHAVVLVEIREGVRDLRNVAQGHGQVIRARARGVRGAAIGRHEARVPLRVGVDGALGARRMVACRDLDHAVIRGAPPRIVRVDGQHGAVLGGLRW